MRKSAIPLLIATALVAVTASGCSNAADDSKVDGSGLPVVDDGSLTVCISKNAYEPLYWKEGSAFLGFDPDSVAAIADELGLEVRYNESAFDGLLPALMSGRCDILRSGLYINDERKANADAIPYLQTGPALIVRAGNPLGIRSPEDLSGVRIAVQGASANEKILREISEGLEKAGKPGIELSVYPELPETIAALQNGRVDATMETDVAATQAAKTLGDDYEVADEIFPAETDFGMFLAKGSELTPKIVEVVQALTAAGTFEDLADEYGLSPSRIVTP